MLKAVTLLTANIGEHMIWEAQLLRSTLLELGLVKETDNEKERSKLQRILALRKFTLSDPKYKLTCVIQIFQRQNC